MLPYVLIASATAKSAQNAVRILSESGKVKVRALVRNLASPTAQNIAALPNVELVVGDFDEEASIENALRGVSRAMLVSAAGQHEMFDRESTFISIAHKENVECIVRVSTASCLIHPGSTGVYARAHACLESFIESNKYPVVDLNPNWFMDNILGSAGEAKAMGQITWPTVGEGKRAFIDPRDIGSAAAHILLQPQDMIEAFLDQRKIELHGPGLTSIKEQLEQLSKAVGYPIKLNTIDGTEWAKIMQSFGLSKLFSVSFLHTVEILEGVRESTAPMGTKSSALMYATGWKPEYDIEAWCNSEHVLAAFRK